MRVEVGRRAAHKFLEGANLLVENCPAALSGLEVDERSPRRICEVRVQAHTQPWQVTY
jgi:hypothetical protein